jgi:hypothetical protein
MGIATAIATITCHSISVPLSVALRLFLSHLQLNTLRVVMASALIPVSTLSIYT